MRASGVEEVAGMSWKGLFPVLAMPGGDDGGVGVPLRSSSEVLEEVRDVEDEAVDRVETEASVEPLRPDFAGGLAVPPGERRDRLVEVREDAPGEVVTGRVEEFPLTLEAQEVLRVCWVMGKGGTETCL